MLLLIMDQAYMNDQTTAKRESDLLITTMISHKYE